MEKQINRKLNKVEKDVKRLHEQPKRRGNKRNNRGRQLTAHLSPCAALYAKTLVDPFGTHGAGLPQDPAVPSLKTWAFARGELTTGTAGIGFIYAGCPNAMSNNSAAGFFTDGTYAGTTLSNAGVGVNSIFTNSPYASASFTTGNTGIRGRVVSGGIRLRYNGTELNRGGTVVAVAHPSHNTLTTSTFAQLDGMNTAKRYRPKAKWVEVLYCPVLNDEYEFSSNVASIAYYLAAMVKAPNGVVATYDWEMFVNYEVNGQIVRGMTKTPIDPVGSAAVSNSLQGTEMVRDNPGDHKEGFYSRVMNTLEKGFSYAVGGAGKAALQYGIDQAGQIAAKTTLPYIERQAASMLASAGTAIEGAEGAVAMLL